MSFRDYPSQSRTLPPAICTNDVELPSQPHPKPLQHLALVLWVSFVLPVIGSTYYLFGGSPSSTTPIRQAYRLIGSLVVEVASLLVLWYVMDKQGKTKKDIGLNFHLLDILRGLGLFVFGFAASCITYIAFQYIYHAYSGHFWAIKSLHSMFGFGVSFLSIAFICLNPFFEELIVRAYAITEVLRVGGTRTLAIAVSVAVQITYHLYQGLPRVLMLAAVFSIYSIYFVRTKRIIPVILAHLSMDLLALLSGKF